MTKGLADRVLDERLFVLLLIGPITAARVATASAPATPRVLTALLTSRPHRIGSGARTAWARKIGAPRRIG